MSRKSFIDRVEVEEPCSKKWEEMLGDDRIRFCTHCAKEVSNLSALDRKEALRMVRASGGNLCIRYIADANNRQPVFASRPVQLTRRRSVVAAGVISASLGLSVLAYGQTEPPANAVVQNSVIERLPVAKDDVESRVKQGAVEGFVRDFQGRGVEGVHVELTDGSTDETDSEGHFSFKDIDAGDYVIRVRTTSGNLKKAGPEFSISAGQIGRQDIAVRVTYRSADTTNDSGSASGFGMGGAMAVLEYSNPLSKAVEEGDIEPIQALLRSGEDINGEEPGYNRITPVFLAVEHADVKILRLLLQNGANINARDSSGRTPIMFIDEESTPELIRALVQAGADVNAEDNDGDTALISGIQSGKADVVEALLNAGARTDAKNKDGKTPLISTVEGEYLDILKLLLGAGADVNAKDKSDETAWDKSSNAKIDEALVNAGAMVSYDLEVTVEPQTAREGKIEENDKTIDR